MMVGDEEWYHEEDQSESGEVQTMCPSESPIVPHCIDNVRRRRLFDAELMSSMNHNFMLGFYSLKSYEVLDYSCSLLLICKQQLP